MVWKPEDGDVTLEMTEADCMTPPPAISELAVFFIPQLLPGTVADVTRWAPGEGFGLQGRKVHPSHLDFVHLGFERLFGPVDPGGCFLLRLGIKVARL